tara:strand:+ start:248 stop:430 length:183 start_codon:yes stop_codon:yes gene_type:complete
MKKNKKPHFLYLIDRDNGSELKMLTEAQAKQIALTEEVEVWNTHQALDLEPEMLVPVTNS